VQVQPFRFPRTSTTILNFDIGSAQRIGLDELAPRLDLVAQQSPSRCLSKTPSNGVAAGLLGRERPVNLVDCLCFSIDSYCFSEHIPSNALHSGSATRLPAQAADPGASDWGARHERRCGSSRFPCAFRPVLESHTDRTAKRSEEYVRRVRKHPHCGLHCGSPLRRRRRKVPLSRWRKGSCAPDPAKGPRDPDPSAGAGCKYLSRAPRSST
jgi:hypothetical protein